MRKLISLITISVSMLIAVSCHTEKQPVYGLSVIPEMIKTFDPDTLDASGIDSVIRADRLPEYRQWKQTTFRDGETEVPVTYRTLYDPQTGTVYTVKPYAGGMYILFKKSLR